ncbi:MAG TPA: LTA synthase family protein [Candidatus Pseudogracilibacillus intestinigallinarum]|uniref:LTA synthase family protein n=1 Tax=Candidatus Pseudogracilibacillus intestinigallinarum TaxID=2838742 RepID=A0A9D1PPS2_9BACI|nr:LTA synthase family protein [Candidatus Pseudogracilibacillus intestinigallinarum]
MKNFISSKMGFFTVAAVLIWIKSYVVYLTEFNLDVQNTLQHFLLLINPISSTLVFLGIALFAKGRRVGGFIIIIHSFMSLLLYANVVFYRFNTDFITLPVLTQTGNFGSLGSSIANLMQWTDLFYALDIIILILLFRSSRQIWSSERMKLKRPAIIIATGLVVFSINLALAEADRPQLLKRTFDRNYIVKYLGAYNFTIYDAIQNVKSSTERVLADSNDITEVQNYTNNKYAEPNEELFGIAEGKNVIKIHLESFHSFLINMEVNGEEVTPFINSLVNDEKEDYTYFENFFHQTEQGKTADAELIMDNSLYGLPQGSAFVTKGKNTYQALPAILGQEQGYKSSVLHGDSKSFWNRDEIYKELGVDYFFDEAFYDMSEEQVIGYGLKDKPFFKESMPIIEAMEEPFYAHFMTLTHHHPYLIDEEDATIDPTDTNDGSVDRYFQTARYLDESLEQFVNDLKEAGLYDDSVIMIYGDHYGISENHTRALSEIFGEEMTPYKYAELQRVPFILKVPGLDGKGTVSEYAGQVDAMPTLLHLLGIDAKDYVLFGTDLFSEEHDDLVPFRNGDFFTEDYAMVKGIFYDNHTGEEIEPTEELEALKEKVEHELAMSDKVLQGDLLRFYSPTDDWKPVDTNDYFYDINQFTVPDELKEKWLDTDTEEDTDIETTENKNSDEDEE